MKKDMKKDALVKIHVRKSDKIVVVAGRERGKTGKILRVYPKMGRVLVSGLNLIKHHVRPTKDLPQGGIIEKEGTIQISNLMIYCSKCARGVRVGIKRLPDGSRMRYCKKCEIEL